MFKITDLDGHVINTNNVERRVRESNTFKIEWSASLDTVSRFKSMTCNMPIND